MIFNQQPPSSGGGGGGATHTIYTTSSEKEYAFRKDGAWDQSLGTTRDAGEVVLVRVNSSSCSYRGRTSLEIHFADVFGNNGLTGSNKRYYAMFVMPDEDITMM